jgi:hypothetical protein
LRKLHPVMSPLPRSRRPNSEPLAVGAELPLRANRKALPKRGSSLCSRLPPDDSLNHLRERHLCAPPRTNGLAAPVQGLGNWTKVATPSASVTSIFVARTCYRFKTKMPSQLNKAPTGVKLALGVEFSLHLLTTALARSVFAVVGATADEAHPPGDGVTPEPTSAIALCSDAHPILPGRL